MADHRTLQQPAGSRITYATDAPFGPAVVVHVDQLPVLRDLPGGAASVDTDLGEYLLRRDNGPKWHEQVALAHLAYAHKRRQEHAEHDRQLQRRRDDIAFQLINQRPRKLDECTATYSDLMPVLQRAVDRIIEAEDAR